MSDEEILKEIKAMRKEVIDDLESIHALIIAIRSGVLKDRDFR